MNKSRPGIHAIQDRSNHEGEQHGRPTPVDERTGSVRRLLFTPSEAAAILGVSRSTLYLLLAEGQLESVKIGSLRRIPTAAIDRYVGELTSVRP